MGPLLSTWQAWAIFSAIFAALTAVFAKVGIAGIDSDFATLIRTGVVIVALAGAIALMGKWQPPREIGARAWVFLVLSGLATGASWLCYFRALQLGEAAKVAPVDKLSVVLVALFGVAFLGERLAALNWLGVLMIAGGAILVALR
jgi:bacterial/archaeal transporter family protein